MYRSSSCGKRRSRSCAITPRTSLSRRRRRHGSRVPQRQSHRRNRAGPGRGSLMEKTSRAIDGQGPVAEPRDIERSGQIGVNVFLDTSAFAKRYVAEPGSEKVISLCQRPGLLRRRRHLPAGIHLHIVQARATGRGTSPRTDYRKLKGGAMADLADMDEPDHVRVLAQVISLLESHPLRAMDAVHVACALVVGPDLFVSADHRQLAAGRKAGLKVLDVS